jgi:uncharacterized protein DUF1932
MFPKAYRFVAEMEEIAEFVGDDPAAQQIYQGYAELYARLAEHDAKNAETDALAAFFRQSKS